MKWIALLAIAIDLGTLFNTLDPQSVSKSLAFYELFPQTKEGSRALSRGCELLSATSPEDVAQVIPYINRSKLKSELTVEDCVIIEKMAAHLPNRKLKGYLAQSEQEVIALPSGEVDLGYALLLSQTNDPLEARKYSALLDLMALQILAVLPENASNYEKIKATNYFIFDQMHFRFPPQSIYAEAIDLYTFLPSVMDDHLGVCLGVTALYLAIAQRIELPLDIITPPGHIFVRHGEINIETTARGIHVPSEQYLGMQACKLEERELKEVIGMTHVNQASVFLHQGRFEDAARSYEKAWPYMEEDALVTELWGYCLILTDREKEGRELLQKVQNHTPDWALSARVLAEDYLLGRTDKEGIATVFVQVDQTRESILEKQKRLQEVLKRHPTFRDGLLQSAICHLQLTRNKEALVQLQRYHEIDPAEPTVQYYLSALQGEMYNFPACWDHLERAEVLVQKRGVLPRPLRDLRSELERASPKL